MNGIDPIIARALGGFKGAAKSLYWRAYGLFVSQPPFPSSPRSLLFVCKGNICRSPFAEAMARKHIPDGLRIVCGSAGIDVTTPEGCPRETLVAAERFGIDLSGHRSRPIDAGVVAGADMVLTMEARQASRLRKLFPEYREKINLLSLFEGTPRGKADPGHLLNIRDPYGRTLEDFIECFERIDACLKVLFSGISDVGMQPPGEEAGKTSWRGGVQAGHSGSPRHRTQEGP